MTDLLTYEQAAEMLDPTGEIGITVRSIRRHVQAGRLRKVKIGRKPAVFKSDLLGLVERMGECLGPDPVKVPLKPDPAKPPRISQRAQRARETRRITAMIRANKDW